MTDIPVSARSTRFIPWLFVGGMLTVIAVNGVLIYYAVSSWSGIAVSRSYDRGLAYNHALESASRQESLGWSFTANVIGQGTTKELSVRATDIKGRLLPDLKLDVTLQRPLGESQTQEVTLTYSEEAYRAPIELGRGQWDAQIAAKRGTDTFYVTKRLTAR